MAALDANDLHIRALFNSIGTVVIAVDRAVQEQLNLINTDTRFTPEQKEMVCERLMAARLLIVDEMFKGFELCPPEEQPHDGGVAILYSSMAASK